ncbi:MAG TPA: type I pullulanase [Sediminibacterium sp.]|jgi:pullulanase|uniref:type I pullulanase n=1 Tax=Sediminibacterium sp. TaxID=1917865 RepID=UPI000BCDFAD0|nr:type I pullulanase [Sediminibacterium sp.]OYY20578.1 MAG: type I pullulanase [Sphingobacteriia bacterium 35-40-8]OZA62173.1 MAG: type I pullulanase [Sphingobacteriia bacterium 39-39-8]HQS25356.1 type I pullulanase [Sediminibacterium sp.]HQS36422.1 type I pullulanase [Sediminibacterium sp.]
MQNILLFFLLIIATQVVAQDPTANYPIYNGNDLGLTYTPKASTFKIWAPTAVAARINFYKTDLGGVCDRTANMQKAANGVWEITIEHNIKNQYYTFQILINGAWSAELIDPYAKACGTNGIRAQVIDLKETNPIGWEQDQSPKFSKENKQTDAVIYELHIRDASIHANSAIQQKGKYLGLAQLGTKSSSGKSTGLSHIKELGVTHIHLLPFYDYNSVDETKPNQYNWGYDPVNYNIPEGSYSTNPADGKVRIKELKELVKTMHSNGLRIIMDVVYNHTALTANSNFNTLAPDYYYRKKADGTFSDASACGNETASDKAMFRKFMMESVLYWVKEYHIDGFRFDLMGIHDIETMNLIADTLRKIKPSIVLYGEGWTAGGSPLPDDQRALKKNASALNGIAVFSDDMRDGIKGSVFNIDDRGFATGKIANAESVKFGIIAAGMHPQIDYTKVNYSKAPYTTSPASLINYADCHDNNILWDKIALSFKEASEKDRIKMHELAHAIVLTSQGTPFLTAGSEFLRTKNGVENSFDKGDLVNGIDWDLKTSNASTYQYIQSLIKIRRAHPAFRMTSAKQIANHLVFQNNLPEGIIAYTLNGAAAGDSWKKIWVAFNGSQTTQTITPPAGNWKMASKNNQTTLNGNQLNLDGSSAVILYQ